MRIDYALSKHMEWYKGDGFYSDGPHFRLDYYNDYVIQPMLYDILAVIGDQNPRWKQMQAVLPERMARHAVFLEKMIGPDGSFPPIGRSITYRAAAFQTLAQLALKEDLPNELPLGQVRAALTTVIRRTLSAPGTFDDNGWLRIGLCGSQPAMGEQYISTGSLYLCSVAFLPLGLGPDAEFWNVPAQPWSQAKLWHQGQDIGSDKVRPKSIIRSRE